jgi:cytochrome c553
MKNLAWVLFVTFSPLLQAGEKVPVHARFCASCHGPQGISSQPKLPNLAGQHPVYLKKQMQDIKSGHLAAPSEVVALLATLSNQDLDELALYYAKMAPAHKEQASEVALGEALYTRGDFGKQITACVTCHGPHGTGNNQAGFPSLAGQHARYTHNQLRAFKNRTRNNDLNHVMQRIAAGMNQEEMQALAEYIEGLH